MKLKYCLRKIIFLVLFSVSAFSAFAEDSHTPAPYRKDEFPQFLKDARRFEIITFGSLPFVCIQSTLGYSTYQYFNHNCDGTYFPNPFAASSYSQEEQIGILMTSIGICVGIGLTDLIIQLCKRGHNKKLLQRNNNDIIINPVTTGTPFSIDYDGNIELSERNDNSDESYASEAEEKSDESESSDSSGQVE